MLTDYFTLTVIYTCALVFNYCSASKCYIEIGIAAQRRLDILVLARQKYA